LTKKQVYGDNNNNNTTVFKTLQGRMVLSWNFLLGFSFVPDCLLWPFMLFCGKIVEEWHETNVVIVVNKQLADKERVAAAIENTSLLTVLNQCIA